MLCCLNQGGNQAGDGDSPPATSVVLQRTLYWWMRGAGSYTGSCKHSLWVAFSSGQPHEWHHSLRFPPLYAKFATLADCCRCVDRLCCSFPVAPRPDVRCSCLSRPWSAAFRQIKPGSSLPKTITVLGCFPGPTASHLVAQAGLWQGWTC